MNVSSRCDLLTVNCHMWHLLKWVIFFCDMLQMWPAKCHMTVTLCDLHYISRQFILLWQTHTRQHYIGPAAVIWLWSPCCWDWDWNQYSRTDLECFCFVSFSQTTAPHNYFQINTPVPNHPSFKSTTNNHHNGYLQRLAGTGPRRLDSV